MGYIIWIIIVIAVAIAGMSKKKQQNGQRDVRGGSQNVAPNQRVNRNVMPNQRVNRNVMPNQGAGQNASAMRQSAGKNMPGQPGRLTPQQAYLRAQPVYRKPDTSSIFERAEANVRETDGDELKRRRDAAGVKRAAIDAADHAVDVTSLYESSELMRQVNDLMITGCLDTLRSERDFVAEGVEMINSYIRPLDF